MRDRGLRRERNIGGICRQRRVRKDSAKNALLFRRFAEELLQVEHPKRFGLSPQRITHLEHCIRFDKLTIEQSEAVQRSPELGCCHSSHSSSANKGAKAFWRLFHP
jgi:hypothetical protein